MHPGRAEAPFLEPGLIYDPYPFQTAEPFCGLGAEGVTDPIGIPAGVVEQPLYPVRCRIASELGQRPAVLAFQAAEQAQQVEAGMQPGLSATEVRGHDMGEQVVEPVRPDDWADLPCSGRHGHRRSSGSNTPT